MKRLVFRVRWDPILRRWLIATPQDGKLVRVTKRAAVAVARKRAREEWRRWGRLSQLVVHLKDGDIETEHTYGRDPVRHKG